MHSEGDHVMNAEELIESNWQKITAGVFEPTPDESRASTFIVEAIDGTGLTILANMNAPIRIGRDAFIEVISILLQSGATTEANSLRIGSSNNASNSLGLCLDTKALCGGTRVINYIVPLLSRMGLVRIGHQRPNTVWLENA